MNEYNTFLDSYKEVDLKISVEETLCLCLITLQDKITV